VLDTTGDRSGVRGLAMDNGEDPEALWGDPIRDEQVWQAHNPTAPAGRLKGVRPYVSSGDGDPDPLDPPGAGGDYEGSLPRQSESFAEAAKAAGIAVTTDFYGDGTHTFPYWERALERSLPMMREAIGA
jgi:diacylglycerol O-acyltransferase/trehalose O-mycolyltransferase